MVGYKVCAHFFGEGDDNFHLGCTINMSYSCEL